MPKSNSSKSSSDYARMDGGAINWLEEAHKDDRAGFVRKVYCLLAVQLTITFGFTAIVMTDEHLTLSIQQTFYLFYPALFLQLFIWCTLVCCIHTARKVPMNYILCTVFTLCWTYMIAFICSFYDPQLVLMCTLMTAVLTITLSVFACVTSLDMTEMCGPFFCWGLLLIFTISMLMSVLSMVVFTFTETWYPFAAGFALIVYGIYLMIDTQLIIGQGRYKLSIDDYIIGSIILYMDIIMIFLKLLEIFSRR